MTTGNETSPNKSITTNKNVVNQGMSCRSKPRQRPYTTRSKFENVALIQRLGLPSTLKSVTRTGLFRGNLQNLKTTAFRFQVDISILKTELFENDEVTIMM